MPRTDPVNSTASIQSKESRSFGCTPGSPSKQTVNILGKCIVLFLIICISLIALVALSIFNLDLLKSFAEFIRQFFLTFEHIINLIKSKYDKYF